MDQVNINVITLDDNKNYEVIDKEIIDNNTYYFLINEDDEKDRCIRKEMVKDNEKFLTTLEEDEFDKVLTVFMNKFKGGK